MRFVAGADARALFLHSSDQSGAQPPRVAQDPSTGLGGLFRAAPFANLSTAVGRWAPFASVAAGVTEQRTGVAFPGELEHCAGQKGCPVITGAGTRTKRIAGVKSLDVYALALYVDGAAARGTLQPKFRGTAPEGLAKDQALFDELVGADGVEKTLRVIITSKLVKQRSFMDALEQRLEPPLKQAGQLAALEAFKRQFDGANFRKGFEVAFTAKGDKLVTEMDGKQVGTIANRQLAHALLDIYLGKDPASQPAKDSFGRGLAAMVAA